MSSVLRAFYGALVGALLVLVVHPYSRPYLLQGVWFLGNSPFLRKTSMLTENLEKLPQARNLEDAGLWTLTACQREFTAQKLTRDETLLVLETIQTAERGDPDNAYWWQVEAVFQHKLGNDEAAVRAWKTASVASRWFDYQNFRLQRVLIGLEKETGRNLGWHYSLVNSRKNPVVPRSVLAYGRQLLRGSNVKDVGLRVATLRNGRLIRDGARTVAGSEMGVELIEVAAYCSLDDPRGFAASGGPITPRMVSSARDELRQSVREALPEAEEEVRDAFLDNDARTAFVNPQDIEARTKLLTLATILTSSLPGALVTIGIIGGAIWLIGVFISRNKAVQSALAPPYSYVFGVASGIVVYLATGLFFPALWAAVAIASFGVRRDRERLAAPGGIGNSYGLALAILAVSFAVVTTMLFATLSVQGEYLFEDAGVSLSPVLVPWALGGLSAVIVSLSLVCASVWGFLSRIPSERLAGPTLAKFGANVCLGCFAAGVALVPIAIGVDRAVSDDMSKIFQNEPTYYLTR